MKKITESVIESFEVSRGSLSERNFKKLLVRELPRYDINREFIERFDSYISYDDICKLSLSKDCITYLMKRNLFNYEEWSSNNIKHKDLSILLDDDFVFVYDPDVPKLLSESNKITQELFDKFIPKVGDDYLKKVVHSAVVSGLNIPLDFVIEHMEKLGDECLNISSVIEDLKSGNSRFLQEYLNPCKKRSLELLLSLLSRFYSPNITADMIESLEYEDIEIPTPETAPTEWHNVVSTLQKYVTTISQTYADEVVEAVFKNVYYYGKEILMNQDILGGYLLDNDNISEECLTTIGECFVLCGLRKDLVTYAKNHNYETLLLAIHMTSSDTDEVEDDED